MKGITMSNQSQDTEKQPSYAVLGGPCGLPLKPVDAEPACQQNGHLEKLPYGVCGQSCAGHCAAAPSESDTEDQS